MARLGQTPRCARGTLKISLRVFVVSHPYPNDAPLAPLPEIFGCGFAAL